jgi:hypothetical protein
LPMGPSALRTASGLREDKAPSEVDDFRPSREEERPLDTAITRECHSSQCRLAGSGIRRLGHAAKLIPLRVRMPAGTLSAETRGEAYEHVGLDQARTAVSSGAAARLLDQWIALAVELAGPR